MQHSILENKGILDPQYENQEDSTIKRDAQNESSLNLNLKPQRCVMYANYLKQTSTHVHIVPGNSILDSCAP